MSWAASPRLTWLATVAVVVGAGVFAALAAATPGGAGFGVALVAVAAGAGLVAGRTVGASARGRGPDPVLGRGGALAGTEWLWSTDMAGVLVSSSAGVETVLGLGERDAAAQLATILRGVETPDLAAVAAAAHRTAGAAGYLGAFTLADLCRRIERGAGARDLIAVKNEIGQLGSVLARSIAVLRDPRRSVS